MNTKSLMLVVVFAALTVVLNPIRIPAIFWPGFFYRLWEIPIVVAFLLFGPRIGISIALLNVTAQIVLFPIPAGIVAYPWGLVATLTMLLGIYVGQRLFKQGLLPKDGLVRARPILYLTSLGVAFRTGIMPFVDYLVYHSFLPIALGRVFTEAYIVALIPSMIVFNITVALYTVPISYIIARQISRSLKLGAGFNSKL